MGLNLKLFSANYKLCATNYKVNGAAHDGRSLRATAPFLMSYPKVLLMGKLSAPLTERLLFESPCRLRDFHKRVRKGNLSGLSGHLPYQGEACGLRTADCVPYYSQRLYASIIQCINNIIYFRITHGKRKILCYNIAKRCERNRKQVASFVSALERGESSGNRENRTCRRR